MEKSDVKTIIEAAIPTKIPIWTIRLQKVVR